MAKQKPVSHEVAQAAALVTAAEGVTAGAVEDAKQAADAVSTAKDIAETKDATDAHKAAFADAVETADIAAGLVEDAKAGEKSAKETLAAAKKSASSKPKHVIADGHALTSGLRVLAPGDAVSAADLDGGDKVFKGFIKSGHIRVND